MRIRSVVEEYEVKLHALTAEASSARGKGEWKVYGDGSRQCKVSINNLKLPERTELQLTVDGRLIGKLIVERGSARFRRESELGEIVPGVRANEILQVLLDDKAILEGSFYAE
jgi:hypothetical protein